eukprot:COSAG01_NODE_3072_length_6637_cov_10.406087_4_plen_275_part_00
MRARCTLAAGCAAARVVADPMLLLLLLLLPPQTMSGSALSNPWGLPDLLHIDWRRTSDLPVGVEDVSGGFIDNDTLVAGFGLGNLTDGCFLANCSSTRDQACWSRRGALLNYHTYRGNPCHGAWFSRVFATSVAGAGVSSSSTNTTSDGGLTGRAPPLHHHKWSELPLPPLEPRQGACGAADPNSSSFYVVGGWSEWAPYPCGHRDGARLQRITSAGGGSRWHWTKLPELPYPVVFGAMAIADGKLFVFGADRYAFPSGTGEWCCAEAAICART